MLCVSDVFEYSIHTLCSSAVSVNAVRVCVCVSVNAVLNVDVLLAFSVHTPNNVAYSLHVPDIVVCVLCGEMWVFGVKNRKNCLFVECVCVRVSVCVTLLVCVCVCVCVCVPHAEACQGDTLTHSSSRE